MTFIALLASPPMLPFSIAMSLVLALLIIELGMSLIGGSVLGDGDLDGDFEVELDAEIVDVADGPAPASAGSAGILSWLGLGKAPFGIWLAGVLTAFGVAGYVLQTSANAIFGAYLPVAIAVVLTIPVGIAIGSRFAQAIGRAIPKVETTAISTRSYGGRRGVITVGTAARGRPAQVRFRDNHGNLHHAMVEPLHDHQEFGQGAEVAILRLKDGSLRAIGLDD
ncbi:MAG: OB-fold-containig protein [Pseudomonadota bacterium]